MSRPPRSPNPLAAAWARLGARERRLAALAATVVGLALLWWLGLAPALRTLREADSQRAALQVQAQQMQRLKTEAEALKALPRLSRYGIGASDLPRIVAASRGSSMKTNPIELSDAELTQILAARL